MKKIKNIILSVCFLNLAVMSCSPSQSSQLQTNELVDKIKTQKVLTKNEKWENFLKNNSIRNLLKVVFENEQERTNYINSQKAIDNQKELEKIKNWIQYFNFINSTITATLFSGQEKYAVKKGSELIDEIIEKNWLWFLFNIDSFTWINFPEENLFEANEQEFWANLKNSNFENGGFYAPKDNHWIDYASTIYSNNLDKPLPVDEDDLDYFEYKEEKRFFMLNQDGFIAYLTISNTYDHQKQLTEKSVQLLPYLYSYSNLIKAKNKLQNFSLAKYTEINESFNEVEKANTEKIKYREYYGGKIRYTFFDVKIS